MSESERPILEEVLDYAVYAPLGLALTILEDLPAVVAKGRRKIQTQVGVARFAGKLAFGQLRRTLDDVLAPSKPTAQEAYGHDGPPQQPPAVLDEMSSSVPEDHRQRTTPPSASTQKLAPADLAIPDYDTLAASQIVARLAGLDASELAAVKLHEELHRGRRTILARIDQLSQSHDD